MAFCEGKGSSAEQDISERLRRRYNVLKAEFQSEVERLKKKKEKLKDVQKSYFSRAKKYRHEKLKHVQRHREAYKKPKLEEYFQKKEYYLREYKLNFREFKQLYEKMNYRFEKRVVEFVDFDTGLKKDYTRVWEGFVCRFLGLNQDSPVLLGLPDLDELFENVLSRDLEKLENGRPTLYSRLTRRARDLQGDPRGAHRSQRARGRGNGPKSGGKARARAL